MHNDPVSMLPATLRLPVESKTTLTVSSLSLATANSSSEDPKLEPTLKIALPINGVSSAEYPKLDPGLIRAYTCNPPKMSLASTGSLFSCVPLDLVTPTYVGQSPSPAPSIYSV